MCDLGDRLGVVLPRKFLLVVEGLEVLEDFLALETLCVLPAEVVVLCCQEP